MDRDRPALRRLGGPLVGLFLLAMVVWPLVAILDRSFADVGPARLAEILGRRSVWSVTAFTVGQALASVVLTLMVGLPIAAVLARYDFRGRAAIRALVVVPFVLPTVVVAASFRALLGRFGVFEQSLPAILAAHVFFNVAVVVRIVGGYWARLDTRLGDAARALGASPVRVLRHVTVPLLAPALVASATLVFLFCFTSYGVILILGGPRRSTLETEIQRYAVFRQEFDVAAVLALVQMIVVGLLALAGARLQRRLGDSEGRDGRRLVVDSARRRLALAGALVSALVVIVAPLAALVESSTRVGDGHGLAHYRRLLDRSPLLPVSPVRALGNSMLFALGAAVVASLCAKGVAASILAGGRLGRIVGALALLPLGISAVTLGFGYLVGFARFDLRRSIWLIPLAHAVIGLPFVLGSVLPALRAIPDRLRQVAATLGASPTEVIRRIERPIIRRAVLTGAGFAVAVSVGEFGATSFLSRSESGFTAPLAVFRLLSRPGDALRGQALALSVVIGAVVAVVALVLERQGELE